MKKILLVAALTVSAGLAMSQTPTKDGVMMMDGKVMMMKNGESMDMSGMMSK